MASVVDPQNDPKQIKHVHVNAVGGDLRLRGEDDPGYLRIEGDMPVVQHEKSEGGVFVTTGGNCMLQVPNTADVHIASIGGDSKISDFVSDIQLNSVGGDLIVRHVGTIKVDAVGGDCQIRHVEGSLHVNAVGGDMDCRNVTNDVFLHKVGGDLSIRNIEGNCRCDDIKRDMLIAVDFQPDKEYQFHCRGDIVCSFEDAEPNVTFILPKGTNYDLDTFTAEVSETAENLHIKFGEGAATVMITRAHSFNIASKKKGRNRNWVFNFDFATPDIDIPEPPMPPMPPMPPNFEVRVGADHFGVNVGDEPLGEYINRQVNEQLERMPKDWTGFGRKFTFKKGDVEAHARREAARAERHAERAERQAERAREMGERMQQRLGKRFGGGNFGGFGHGGAESTEATQAVSEQERLMVLKLLEDGKISVEEAERLLRTMEGNG